MNLLPRGQVVDDLREKIKTYIDRVNDLGFHRGGIPGIQRRPSKATEAHAYLELTKALLHAIPFDWKTSEPIKSGSYIAILEDKVDGKRWMMELDWDDVSHWHDANMDFLISTRLPNVEVIAWSLKPSSKELGGR